MKRFFIFSFLVVFLLVVGCSYKMDNKIVVGDVSVKMVQIVFVIIELVLEKEEFK